MAQMGLLLYDRSVLEKLILHLAMDDPKLAAKERAMLEKRIIKIEGVLKLLVSKGRLERVLEDEVKTLGTD